MAVFRKSPGWVEKTRTVSKHIPPIWPRKFQVFTPLTRLELAVAWPGMNWFTKSGEERGDAP
jgi:hypothetical protein